MAPSMARLETVVDSYVSLKRLKVDCMPPALAGSIFQNHSDDALYRPEICGGCAEGMQTMTGPESHWASWNSHPLRGAIRRTIGRALPRIDEYVPRWVFFDSDDVAVYTSNGS